MVSKTDCFSSASLGVVLLFLVHLKGFQPHRHQLFAAVTDCRVIQFVRAEGPAPDELAFKLSAPMPLLDSEGLPAVGLCTLLSLLSDQNLSAMPTLRWGESTLTVNRYLGAGGSACVFSATPASSGAKER
jgi:hypothetical protein